MKPSYDSLGLFCVSAIWADESAAFMITRQLLYSLTRQSGHLIQPLLNCTPLGTNSSRKLFHFEPSPTGQAFSIHRLIFPPGPFFCQGCSPWRLWACSGISVCSSSCSSTLVFEALTTVKIRSSFWLLPSYFPKCSAMDLKLYLLHIPSRWPCLKHNSWQRCREIRTFVCCWLGM